MNALRRLDWEKNKENEHASCLDSFKMEDFKLKTSRGQFRIPEFRKQERLLCRYSIAWWQNLTQVQRITLDSQKSAQDAYFSRSRLLAIGFWREWTRETLREEILSGSTTGKLGRLSRIIRAVDSLDGLKLLGTANRNSGISVINSGGNVMISEDVTLSGAVSTISLFPTLLSAWKSWASWRLVATQRRAGIDVKKACLSSP